MGALQWRKTTWFALVSSFEAAAVRHVLVLVTATKTKTGVFLGDCKPGFTWFSFGYNDLAPLYLLGFDPTSVYIYIYIFPALCFMCSPIGWPLVSLVTALYLFSTPKYINKLQKNAQGIASVPVLSVWCWPNRHFCRNTGEAKKYVWATEEGNKYGPKYLQVVTPFSFLSLRTYQICVFWASHPCLWGI